MSKRQYTYFFSFFDSIDEGLFEGEPRVIKQAYEELRNGGYSFTNKLSESSPNPESEATEKGDGFLDSPNPKKSVFSRADYTDAEAAYEQGVRSKGLAQKLADLDEDFECFVESILEGGIINRKGTSLHHELRR